MLDGFLQVICQTDPEPKRVQSKEKEFSLAVTGPLVKHHSRFIGSI